MRPMHSATCVPRRWMPSRTTLFRTVDASGPMQGEVELFLPFKAFDQRRTLVHAHLLGVSLNRRGAADDATAATELYGDADIDGAQVAHADVHGQLLGGAFQMQARAPRPQRNLPTARTVLVFNGVLGGESAALGAGPSGEHRDRRYDRLARGSADGAGTGSRALAAHQQQPGRTRTRFARAARQTRRRAAAILGRNSMACRLRAPTAPDSGVGAPWSGKPRLRRQWIDARWGGRHVRRGPAGARLSATHRSSIPAARSSAWIWQGG